MPQPVESLDRRIVAPYVTSWSSEQVLPAEVVILNGSGVAYDDETPIDRDSNGVLWYRVSSNPGQGSPEFGDVHSYRQRHAMRRLLCQVCGSPADRTADGVLWLLKDHRDDWAGWPESMAVSEPPVCVPCVHMSVRRCPALRHGAVAVRAREFPVIGVRGMRYAGVRTGAIPIGNAMMTFDDPAIPWMRATNLLRELHDCAIVPLKDLA